MSLIQIRQIPDDYAESTGLAKYNRSRMPGTTDRFMADFNIDGRRVTGIDEGGYGVDKERFEKLAELRKNLEQRTQRDLSANSTFWDDFVVEIYADEPKIFNTEIPMDEVAIKMLIANRYVAPTKNDISNPLYRDAQYYAFTEESEVEEEISIRKKRDKALIQLLDMSDNKEKMILYGQYLEGLKYHSKLGENTLYKMLRAYIDDKEMKNAINFLAATKKSVEEIQQKIIVDKALKQRLINRVGTGGKKSTYQYGQVTVGNTIEEVYKNLGSPDFAPELMSIKNELEGNNS